MASTSCTSQATDAKQSGTGSAQGAKPMDSDQANGLYRAYQADHDAYVAKPPPKLPKRRYPGWVWAIIAILALCLFYVAVMHKARAHMADRPELNGWAMAQTNRLGAVCCNEEEVVQLSDSEWRITAGHFEAFHEGRWWTITDDMLSPGPNKLSEAILWWYAGGPRCFKPANLY